MQLTLFLVVMYDHRQADRVVQIILGKSSAKNLINGLDRFTLSTAEQKPAIMAE